MVATPKTEAEAAAMEAAAAKFRQTHAAEIQAERRTKVQPVRDLVTSEAFKTVRDQANELRVSFADIDGIDVHLRPLARFMDGLQAALDAYAPAEAAPAPAPSE